MSQGDGGGQEHTMTFTEEGMRLHADNCAAERDAAKRRKSAHRPPTPAAGTGWRVPSGSPAPGGSGGEKTSSTKETFKWT
jgi:hypothetical protein